MRIKLTSIMVDDQNKAERFYTEVLGFVKKVEIPMGEFRWLTVVSADGRDDLQLSLEPNANPAGRAFQDAMFQQGIPVAATNRVASATSRTPPPPGIGLTRPAI